MSASAERAGTATARADPAPAISFRAVAKSYGPAAALHALDLDIQEGEFFCLLGPSGCGKTTTLNLIGGFVAPSSGAILVQGARVDRVPPHRRSVNTVFQSYALFPHMSVRGNVGFGLRMARVPKREAASRVEDALRLVGLEQLAHRLPGQLSGGQQQRVAVARALVNRPAVLLLDEPLGALDLKLRRRLQIELSQIHRDVGTTFVYVTHDQEEAMSMADRIAVMNEGRIEQIGTPEEVYRWPRSRFVADFIGESNFITVDADGNGVGTCADGSRVACPAGPRGRGVLMLRPEDLRLAAEGAPGLRGRVVQASFLGSATRLAVSSEASDTPITVALHGPDRAGGPLEPDTPVTLAWDPDHAVLLLDEPTTKEAP